MASLVLLNFPLLIDGIGSGFLKMVAQGGASTPLYYYALIPLLTLVSLIIINVREILLLLREFLSRMHHYSRWNRAPKTITGQTPKRGT